MIDIGVNLTNQRFTKDRDEVISRAKIAGLSALIVTGTSEGESESASRLCLDYPSYLFSTAGVHPHDANNVSQNYLEVLTELAIKSHVVAIGECGLDFNRNFSAPKQQIKVFQEQIALAASLNMPLFLHQRDAFEEWYQCLSPYLDRIPNAISHCFTGSKKELQQCLEADMYIGITGWLCDERRGQALRDIVAQIPLNRLLIETDAPYLTPRSIRPKPKSSRNEPSYLPHIVKAIAALTDYTEEQIIHQTAQNTQQVFLLGP